MKLLISLASVKLSARDIKRIEGDPVGLAKLLYTKDLVSILKQCSDKYYNSGTSPLSDRAFDALKEELEARNPAHPFLQKVGAPVKGSRKVALPFQLFSLDKIKPETADAWLTKHRGPYVVSDKEDGNSLEIVYNNGTLSGLFRRGDRLTGEDVTSLGPHLTSEIPPTVPVSGKFAVRAEVIMPTHNFDRLFKEKYANPRNLVAGALTKRTVHEAIPHVHVVAYEIIEPRYKPSAALALLKKFGFNVVPYKVYPTLSSSKLQAILKSRKSKSKYEIDGLVIEEDRVNKRPTSGTAPPYAVAFKAAQEENTALVKVKEVVWEESKHGALKPRIRIDPVKLSGVTVEWATGHNAYFIEHGYRSKDKGKGLPVLPIGPGAVIKIIRSGDVIPHVIEVVKGTRPQMPSVEYKYGRTGIDIYLTTKTDLVKAKRIASFFSTVGVDFLRLNTIEKLMEHGYDTLPKILRATPSDFLSIPGVKDTLAQKWYTAIQSKTREVELATLMDASGIFGVGIGTRRLQPLVDKYPNLMTWGDLTTGEIENRVRSVPGFNQLAKQFAAAFPKFLKWIKLVSIKPVLPTKVKKRSSVLSGQVVAFTGFRDRDLEATIISNGGVVGSGVSTKTTILLVKDRDSGSSKLKKALAQGIKIMTADEFLRKFKLR